MGSEEGLKALADEFDELDKRGCLVNKIVRMKDNSDVYIDYRNKLGKIYIDDPRYDLLEIELIEPPYAVLIAKRDDYYDES